MSYAIPYDPFWPTIALIASLALTLGIGVWLYRRQQPLKIAIWLIMLCCLTLVYSALHALSGFGAGPGCLFMPIVSIVIISVMANWEGGAGIRGNLLPGLNRGGSGDDGFDGGFDFDGGGGSDGGGGGESGFD